jgi:hypothetical protein
MSGLSALIGALRVTLGMDSAEFSKGADSAARQANAFEARMQKMGSKLTAIGKGMTLGLTAPLVAFGVASSKAATESGQAVAAMEASLRSMGDAAGYNSEQLQKQAAALQATSTFDDDDILRRSLPTCSPSARSPARCSPRPSRWRSICRPSSAPICRARR